MKTLNLRLVIILGISVVVLSIAVYFVHGWQNQSNARFYYDQAELSEERAKKAENEGDPEAARKEKMQAIKELSWYLNLKPDDIDAEEKLGLLLADLAFNPDTGMVAWNMFSPAWIQLENVVGQDPNRTDARHRLIKLAMRVRRFKDAREHVEALLSVSPKDAELPDLLGQCQQSVREFEDAAKSYQEAVELDPAQLDTYGRLARLLRYRLQKPDDADESMEKLVEANAKSGQAHFLHGAYLKTIKSNEKALTQTLKGLPLIIKEMEGPLKQLEMSSDVEKDLSGLHKLKLTSGEEITEEKMKKFIKRMKELLEEAGSAITAMKPAGREFAPDVTIARAFERLDRVFKLMKEDPKELEESKWKGARKELEELKWKIGKIDWNEKKNEEFRKSSERVVKWIDRTLKTNEELDEFWKAAPEEPDKFWKTAPEGLLLASQCASAKISEDWSRDERELGDLIPRIEATFELSEDGRTVSRIMVGPVKENGEDDTKGETSPEQTKPKTITGKIVAADAEASTVTLIRDSGTGKPKEETLAVSPEVEFASNYAGLARRYVKQGIELTPTTC